MARVETIGDATLYLGDCRELLSSLPKFDAVAADPPYGINYRWHGGGRSYGRWKQGAAEKSETITGDAAPFDPTPWLAYPCILFGADHYCDRLPTNGRWLIWDKRRGVCPPRSQSDAELIFCSEPGPRRICYHLWDGMVRDSEIGVQREHPTQKPIEVMRWCVEFLPPTARTILDPFMGSGTTGIAALSLSRRFLGVEIEPKYFDIACRRIEEAARQYNLFETPKLA